MLLGAPFEGVPLTGMLLDIRDRIPNYYPFSQTTTHAMTTPSGQTQMERKETTRGDSSKQKETSAGTMASEAAQKTRKEASHLADKAKTQLADQAEQQKARASDQLDGIGEALRETSSTLHERDKDSIANLTEGAAHQIERLSHYLRGRSVNEMLSDATRFARRQPSMFLGGAAVLGFFGSRFLRSSDPGLDSDRRRRQGQNRHERSSERADHR